MKYGIKILETERLILRELEESDAQDMYTNWASDDEVSKYVRWSTHKNVEETKEYIKCERERCRTEGCYNWGIVIKEKNELIGAIGAFPSENGRYEIGYNLSRKHWRNGYATEALKKVMKYLINNEEIYNFKCAHAILNPASGSVMKKVGFTYSHEDTYEKFDGSELFEAKVYYLDIDKIKLIRPTKQYEKQIIEYKNEHIKNGENIIHACSKLDKMDNFDEWLALVKSNTKKETVQTDWTVTTQFLGIREKDNKIVGMISVRHELVNDFLKNYAGHIGYGVRPTERKKGYASQMLEKALIYCKEELKLNEVMVNCTKENKASRKTIINAGGVLESEYKTEEGENVQKYWIKI